MTNTPNRDTFFLGLDSSTQALKATLIDHRFQILGETRIRFDEDVPEFGTRGGVHRHADGHTVTSPAMMWVAALDLLCGRMKTEGWPLNRVAALSGSGQQHGSVWLRRGARDTLRRLRADRPLREQLEGAFSVADSPVWMDSSTTAQCRALESALGGPQAVAERTGSRAFERFTGNQIAKLFQTRPDAYAETERIALVSSFMASLWRGDYAPIDASDGSGMNLMDLRTKDWADEALRATAPGLREKLGTIVPSHADIGPLHPAFILRYGFSPECRVIAFSGDNPNSLAGLRLEAGGDLAVSLGTSDTVFGFLTDARPSASGGHIFVNPVDPDAFMALICFQNGSLTREFVRDTYANGSWPEFERRLGETAPGNGGRIGLYVREPEITPPIPQTGIYLFDPTGKPAASFTPAEHVRAVLEGQCLSMRRQAGRLGLDARRLIITGGASANAAVRRVLADVFGLPIRAADQPDSAALGAACRARHGWTCSKTGTFVSFAQVMADAPPFHLVTEPDARAHAMYNDRLAAYAAREQSVMTPPRRGR